MTILFIKAEVYGERRTIKKMVDVDAYFVVPRQGDHVKIRSSQNLPLTVRRVLHDIQAEVIEVELVDQTPTGVVLPEAENE